MKPTLKITGLIAFLAAVTTLIVDGPAVLEKVGLRGSPSESIPPPTSEAAAAGLAQITPKTFSSITSSKAHLSQARIRSLRIGHLGYSYEASFTGPWTPEEKTEYSKALTMEQVFINHAKADFVKDFGAIGVTVVDSPGSEVDAEISGKIFVVMVGHNSPVPIFGSRSASVSAQGNFELRRSHPDELIAIYEITESERY